MAQRTKKPKPGFSICGKCHKRVDLDSVLAALRKGQRYDHECGKRLVHGDRKVENVKGDMP